MEKYSLQGYLGRKVLEKYKALPFEFRNTSEWEGYRDSLSQWLFKSLPVIKTSYTGKGSVTGSFVIGDSVILETCDVGFEEGLFIHLSLYKPERAGKYPAVIICPGFCTAANSPDYVELAVNLASNGIIASVVEYGGTGIAGDRPDCVTNIGNISAAAHLLGMNEAGLRVSYNISVLEYMMSRSDVLEEKIGITGLCQGAISLMYTVAADDRIAACAPLCGVSTYAAEVTDYASRQGGWTGISPFVFDVLDHGDFMHFLACFAPKPMLVVNNLTDIHWPLSGLEEVKVFISQIYGLYGKEKRACFTMTRAPHSYDGENGKAVVDFFINELVKCHD